MTESSDQARSIILKRIGAATAGDPAAEYESIAREYIRSGTLSPEERLHMLQHRLEEYDATVYHATPALLPELIARILSGRAKSRIAVPDGIPPAWLPLGFSFLAAENLSPSELDGLDGVLTGCTVAIAATGTLVLQTVPGQGSRKLSLVPDYHLCVVNAAQVVETVPEGFAALAPTMALATTFISGPSATADIEMTRIKGVHGPRFLDVILTSAP